jgi:hypothetical protein
MPRYSTKVLARIGIVTQVRKDVMRMPS